MKTKRNLLQFCLLAVVVLPVVAIHAAPVVTQVSAGYSHSLFLKSDGSLWAMGNNTWGELGNGTTDSTNQPEQIVSSNVTAVVASQLFSLFLKSDGSLWGMGINDFGQLGDGTTTEHHTPVQIATNVTAVAAGLFHTLFITNGSLWVVGHNNHGQLGNSSITDSHIPIQIVPSGVTKIAAGGDHSLFIKSDGSLWAMGWNNFGQLGDGTTTERHAPVQIAAAHITAIAAGEYHNLFITNGNLYAMGQNFYGQLGDGTATDRHTPVLIPGGGVAAIAAGFDHSLFITNGSLWAMGWNNFGQLGDGTTDNGTYQTNSPERIVAGGVRAIAGGNGFSLFARNDGSLWAMGWNGDGELGDSTLNSTNLPEQIVAGSPPVVTLIGSATMTNECHFAFTDPGTTNVLGLPVTVTGSVNTNSPGIYLLTYTVTNSLGTNTTTRTVTVVDTTAPVITILAYNPMTVLTNTPFVDPGAIALDACGGSFAVTTNGSVNTAVAGNYTITYSATDSYGNTAMATRIVVVNAQVLYSDNFDSGASDATNWNINLDIGDNAATFGFDYSTVGIPPAPNAGGTTIGVKLEANYTNSTSYFSGTGVSISPKGRSFSGNYKVTFDMWENFVGDAQFLGNGTTQLTGAGIGTSGDYPEDSGHYANSLWFAQTGDGGNAAAAKDYRIYSVRAIPDYTGYATNSGVYASGISPNAADNFNPQYAALGGNTVPAAQTTISGGSQNGTTRAGCPGFAWHQVTILKWGNTVTYTIDSTLIATVDISTITLSGGDIEFIQSDVNSSASSDPNVRTFEFGLIDDVSVVAIPPPVFSLLTKTNSTVTFRWNATPNLVYQVQYKTNLTQANWINLGSAVSATNVTVTATDTPGTDTQRFYRLMVLP